MQHNKRRILSNVAPVFLFAAIVLLISWTTGPFHYHFSDTRLVTLYSLFQLLATAYISFLVFKSLEKESSLQWRQNPSARPFFITAIGFLLLGFDEVLSLHENMDRLIHIVLRIKETPLTDHIDDIIVLIYGIIAIFFIKDFVKEFRRHPYMVGLIVGGFIAFFTMFCFDFISNNEETFMYFFGELGYHDMRHKKDIFSMIEDSFKLLGESFFLAAFVAAFADIKTEQK